jgi:hypothetical protein
MKAGQDDRTRAHTIALFVSLAGLAERVAGRCLAVRFVVLLLLRRAEELARDYAALATGTDGLWFDDGLGTGCGAAEAELIALRFHDLAAFLAGEIEPGNATDRAAAPRGLQAALERLCALPDVLPGASAPQGPADGMKAGPTAARRRACRARRPAARHILTRRRPHRDGVPDRLRGTSARPAGRGASNPGNPGTVYRFPTSRTSIRRTPRPRKSVNCPRNFLPGPSRARASPALANRAPRLLQALARKREPVMELTIPWPTSTGETLAFSSAVCAILAGFAALILPRLWAGLGGEPRDRAAAAAALRGAAGFPIGLGLAALVLAQPLVYLALGAGWLFAAVGRAVSLFADRTAWVPAILRLVLDLALAALPLGYAFGLLP